ncbi:unnamed protein product [Protopolystoma xenopodis]|uniref:Uncharacterized protein n=1 Tax=Protopolystoma xenopodis TaxID=117903 RepID=A0A448XSQ1_9PLAT|nr:unnamed protein product [Protopolystoma xenopodis]
MANKTTRCPVNDERFSTPRVEVPKQPQRRFRADIASPKCLPSPGRIGRFASLWLPVTTIAVSLETKSCGK